MKAVQALQLLGLGLLLSGCLAGPRFSPPQPSLPAQFVDSEPGQREGSLLWGSFANAELDAVLARVEAANPDLQAAAARLAESRALAGLTVYSRFPTVTAAIDAERSQPSGRDPFLFEGMQRFDVYRAGFDAEWEIDLFGSLRHQAEQIYRRVAADRALLDDLTVSLRGEAAQAWFALRAARAEQRLRRALVHNGKAAMQLEQLRFDAGRSDAGRLAEARSLHAEARAEAALAASRSRAQALRLARLLALPLEQLEQLAPTAGGWPELPALQGLGSPRDWLLRRADVRAAEHRLAAAYADIGYQSAQYFPILELVGGFGWTAQSFGALGSDSAERWSFGPRLDWRFLDFGRVRQQVRAAEARRDAALAQYQSSVLAALEEAQNALSGWHGHSRAHAARQQVLVQARRQEQLARQRFQHGASSRLDALAGERARLLAELAELHARLAQATALVAVYKAFAGDFAEPMAAEPYRR